MNRILPKLILAALTISSGNVLAEDRLFELRLAEDRACAGCIQKPGIGEGAYLVAQPSVMDEDIATVTISRVGQPSTEISLQLTTAGEQKLRAVTSNNIGKRLAILVQGEVISAPIIKAEIRSGLISFELNSRQKAKEFLNRLLE